MRILRLFNALSLSVALLLIPGCKSETAANNTDTAAISNEQGTDTGQTETTSVTVTDTKSDTTVTTTGKEEKAVIPRRH